MIREYIIHVQCREKYQSYSYVTSNSVVPSPQVYFQKNKFEFGTRVSAWPWQVATMEAQSAHPAQYRLLILHLSYCQPIRPRTADA
jgi:hypothetical protein